VKAALSLDLDNLWSYLKIRGDARWSEYPSYLPSLVPQVLEQLDRAGLRITFFVVGTDAQREENLPALRAIARAGHDVGNHSHRHESWMHRYTPDEVRTELATAEDAIARATGVRPNGFRAPGFALSRTVLDELSRRNYRYDASTLPTFVGPLARAYYFRRSRLDARQREERSALFGSWRDGLLPNRPHRRRDAPLLELPVTVTPILRTPFHVSYLLYIASYSRAAALGYFRAALELCAATKTMPSLLLHPLDFLGAGEAPGLEFFPGMSLEGKYKRALVDDVLAAYARRFDVVAMDDAADDVEKKRPELAGAAA
jgi:hypothetical protein